MNCRHQRRPNLVYLDRNYYDIVYAALRSFGCRRNAREMRFRPVWPAKSDSVAMCCLSAFIDIDKGNLVLSGLQRVADQATNTACTINRMPILSRNAISKDAPLRCN